MSVGVLRTLDREQVDEALSSARTRGSYLIDIVSFFESGELAVDFSEKYPSVDAASLRNSIDQNCKRYKAESKVQGINIPEYRIVKAQNGDKQNVLLINMDVYNLQSQTDEA